MLKRKNNSKEISKSKQKFYNRRSIRILIYIIGFLLSIGCLIFTYIKVSNNITNKVYLSKSTTNITRSSISNNNEVKYDTNDEMSKYFGKNVTFNNNGTTKLNLPFTYKVYQRTSPLYINNYGHINDGISCYKEKIKNDLGQEDMKDIINIRYRDLKVKDIKINQKIDTIEIIINANTEKNSTTKYYQMKINMKDLLDKNIKKIVLIQDDAEILSSSVSIE